MLKGDIVIGVSKTAVRCWTAGAIIAAPQFFPTAAVTVDAAQAIPDLDFWMTAALAAAY